MLTMCFLKSAVPLTNSFFATQSIGAKVAMYAEIHRHLVLCKNLPGSPPSRFRQIVVVEREQFEVCVFDSDTLQLDLKFTDVALGTDIQFHTTLPLAVLTAECEYKQSVRTGWRAYDPVHHTNAVGLTHRRSAA